MCQPKHKLTDEEIILYLIVSCNIITFCILFINKHLIAINNVIIKKKLFFIESHREYKKLVIKDDFFMLSLLIGI